MLQRGQKTANSSFLHLQHVAPSSDFHNKPGRSSQWLRPLITGGSPSSGSVVSAVGFAWAGVPHTLFFSFFFPREPVKQRSPSLPLAGAAGRCPQLRKLPVSTNQPHIQTSRCGIRSGAVSSELFPEGLRDSQTWLRQKKKKRKRNTRQGDRQKNKEEKR